MEDVVVLACLLDKSWLTGKGSSSTAHAHIEMDWYYTLSLPFDIAHP